MKTLHQMTNHELKAEQMRLKEVVRVQHMDHIISGCQCIGDGNPFSDVRPCDIQMTQFFTIRRMRTVRSFRAVRYCQNADICAGTFWDRFCGIWGVVN